MKILQARVRKLHTIDGSGIRAPAAKGATPGTESSTIDSEDLQSRRSLDTRRPQQSGDFTPIATAPRQSLDAHGLAAAHMRFPPATSLSSPALSSPALSSLAVNNAAAKSTSLPPLAPATSANSASNTAGVMSPFVSASVSSGTAAAVPAMSAAALAVSANASVAATLAPAPAPAQVVSLPAPVAATGAEQPAGAQKQMQAAADGVAAGAAGAAVAGLSAEFLHTRNVETMAE